MSTLSSRRKLINLALKSFENNDFDVFVNIISSQIEELLVDFSGFSGIELAQNDYIANKLDKIEKKHSFWGYQYFRFDFPKLRNTIVHGKYLDSEYDKKPIELIAYELLLDLNYLTDFFIESETPFNSLKSIIEDISHLLNDDMLSDDYLFDALGSILEDEMQSDFLFTTNKDDILNYYGYLEERDKFIVLLSNNVVSNVLCRKAKWAKINNNEREIEILKRIIKRFGKHSILKAHNEHIAKALF